MKRSLIPALCCALVLLGAASLLAGRVWLDPAQSFGALFSGRADLGALILADIRLPRMVLAVMVGATLGLSGAVLQGFTRNPLAEPGLLGVSSGAALGAVIALYFGIAAVFPLAGPVFGLAGALGAATLTFALARRGSMLTLILAGAAVSSFAAACISLALNLAPNPYAAYEIMTWLMGSLADRSWIHVLLVAPFAILGFAMLATTGRALDALSLGEVQARSLGVDLSRLRLIVILGTALGVGATTAVTGAIGFIGLVAPHLVRSFVGHEPRRVLLPAALCGAILLLAADIGARLLHFGPELKLGVFTSIVGAPFFFWLVIRLGRSSP